MKKYQHQHDYLILILGGVIFLILLKIFQGEKVASFMACLSFVFLYIIWSVYHHAKSGILVFKNVVEYIMIGFTILILAAAIFLF